MYMYVPPIGETLRKALSRFPKSDANLSELIEFCRSNDPIKEFQELWGLKSEDRIQELWVKSTHAFKERQPMGGTPDELLLCMAYDVTVSPYIGVPKEITHLYLHFVLKELRGKIEMLPGVHYSLKYASLTPKGAALFYGLDLLSRAELIRLAENWLVNGIESPSLCLLAGEVDPFSCDACPLFEKAVVELGIELPEESVAAIEILRYYLTLIASGSIDAYEGMVRIDGNICPYSLFPDKVYVGDGMGLEKMYTWYRELQDAYDGSMLTYYTDHPIDEAIQLFKQHLVEEAKMVLSDFPDPFPLNLRPEEPVPRGYIPVIPCKDSRRMT